MRSPRIGPSVGSTADAVDASLCGAGGAGTIGTPHMRPRPERLASLGVYGCQPPGRPFTGRSATVIRALMRAGSLEAGGGTEPGERLLSTGLGSHATRSPAAANDQATK